MDGTKKCSCSFYISLLWLIKRKHLEDNVPVLEVYGIIPMTFSRGKMLSLYLISLGTNHRQRKCHGNK